MPLETATFISDLNANNPAHTDQLNQDDSHMRLVKATLKATFPNITGAITVTQAQINSIAGLTYPFVTASLADASVTTAKLVDANVTYGKIQNVAASKLLGNPTATAAAPAEITLAGGLGFNAGTLTINDNGVAPSKLQQIGQGLLGNPTGVVANPSLITFGGGLKFNGSTIATTFNSASHVNNLVIAPTGNPLIQTGISWDQIYVTDTVGNGMLIGSSSVIINFTTTGAGGVDVSTRGASQAYDLYVIANGTLWAGLAVLEGNAPTMPAGYTFKKRVGWTRTDASSNLYQIQQRGNRAQYLIGPGGNFPLMWAPSTNQSLAVNVRGIWTPQSAVSAIVGIMANNGYGGSWAASNGNYALTGNGVSGVGPLPQVINTYGTGYSYNTGPSEVYLEADTVYCHTDGGANFYCTGWTDNL